MRQIYSGSETFQFPVVVSIQKNNPRQALNVEGLPNVVPELCEHKIANLTVNTYDSNLNPIEADIRFKCFDILDGYQATFHIYDKDSKKEIHYQIDFVITGTEYHTTNEGQIKSNADIIKEEFGNVENYLKKNGLDYIKNKIKHNNLKNETVNILALI